MTFDGYWAFVWSAIMAGFLLWHLLSGRLPVGQARRYRRDAPHLYWFQMLVLAGSFTLTAILLYFDDRRAMILFFGGMLVCGIPSLLRETLPNLTRGNVPGSDDRAGRFFIRVALTLGTLACLTLVAWITIDIARNPPW